MAVKPIPEGYHTVTPFLVTAGVSRIIDFLKATFDAVELERTTDDKGRVMHAEVRVGDSIVMLGEPTEKFPGAPGSLYVYVPDTDAVYRKAIEAGGVSLMEPANQFYGDRNAGVQDPSGNQWWIGTHIEDVSHEEVARRARERK